jgi:diguanylate cyclase (GGDEF)-like protein/PAS domain S-box-containing protein
VLCGIAVLANGAALWLQDRALSADLGAAARDRLERAALAADRLLVDHLHGLLERYRAISRTPELRANLEVNHPPTLRYYARRVAVEQRAALLLFLDRDGRVTALAGDETLGRAAAERLLDPGGEPCDPASPGHRSPDPEAALLVCRDHRPSGQATLISVGDSPHVVAAVPLYTEERRLGDLVAAEPIGADTLRFWSELTGTRVMLISGEGGPQPDLVRAARRLGGLELRVEASLAAERRALANARRNLLTAGALALAVAFGASLLVARGFVRPIRAIQNATEPIGRGELGLRLRSRRRDEIGEVSRAFDAMLDQLQATLAALRLSENRLSSAQRLARLGSWSLELSSDTLVASPECRRIYGFDPREDPVTRARMLRRIHPEDRERFQTALRGCIEDGTPFRLDHRSVEIDGSERFLHSQGTRVSEAGQPQRVEGTVQDITQRKLVEEQARYLAYHDSLTGLGNRSLFREQLELAIRRARAEGGHVGVLFVDLDGFKLINDTFGHSMGDELLREVADRIARLVHDGKVTRRVRGEEGAASICRLGGDEFGILLPDIEAVEAAGRVARRVLGWLSDPFDIEGHELVVSGSIGIATWPADGEEPETLLRNCDTAMFHAKEQGRNNYQFYSESMNALVFKRLLLENKLRRAVERDELELQFQPKVSLRTGQVQGLEALARWRDPDLGIVSPTEFIPLAEEAGLIVAIGDWVLRAAVNQLAAWRETPAPALRLSVNVSGHQLRDDRFVRRVVEVLDEARVDPHQLDLEITETALMGEDAAVTEALDELRGIGVTISLDDFGTGYSSLSYLRRLPIDTVKIDRSFIRRADEEPDDAALIGAIVSMARVLRLCVAVEGVETQWQLGLLQELGCDEVQGNLLSPPVVAQDVARVCAEIDEQKQAKRRTAGRQRRRRR